MKIDRNESKIFIDSMNKCRFFLLTALRYNHIYQRPNIYFCDILVQSIQKAFAKHSEVSDLSDLLFHILDYFVWLRITDEGSVPEMRIWSNPI